MQGHIPLITVLYSVQSAGRRKLIFLGNSAILFNPIKESIKLAMDAIGDITKIQSKTRSPDLFGLTPKPISF